MQPVSLSLPYQAPYHWDAILRFLAARSIPGVEVVSDGRYLRTVAIDGSAGVIAVAPGAADSLTLRLYGFDSVPSARAHAQERVRQIFDLDADPHAIARHFARDPALAPLVSARPGLRVPGAWDGFEIAIRGILGQQITVSAGIRLAARLVQLHGAPVPMAAAIEPSLTHLFPSPAQLAGGDLSSLGMPGARRAALTALATRAAADPELFARGASLHLSVSKLRALPGIGEWTAQYIAMRALREADAFLAADVGLHRALTRPDGTRPTPKEMLAMATAWSPYRAYAALHLWTSLG